MIKFSVLLLATVQAIRMQQDEDKPGAPTADDCNAAAEACTGEYCM